MEELQRLKAQGKVRHIGISVPDHRSDMVLPIVASGLIDSVQTIVNIFDPTALEVLVPLCAAQKVAVIARCILDEGGLTGLSDPRDGLPRRRFSPRLLRRDRAARELYREGGRLASLRAGTRIVAGPRLAIKFVLKDLGITTAITSMHVPAFADANIAAVEEPELDDDTFQKLMTRHRFIKNFNNVKHFGRL